MTIGADERSPCPGVPRRCHTRPADPFCHPSGLYAVHAFLDVLRFLGLCLRSSPALAAENLFLRKQLALYQEHHVTPRRVTHTRHAANELRLKLGLLVSPRTVHKYTPKHLVGSKNPNAPFPQRLRPRHRLLLVLNSAL